jgi:hypothetical protein
MIHEKPGQHGSWALHDIRWYVGPAMEHYHCWTMHVTSTNSECIGDIVEFFPQYTKVPRLSSADAATYAARDLIYALQHPQPAGPFAPTDPTLEALKKLANIFAIALPLTETAAAPRVEVTTIQLPNTHHQYNTHSQAQPSIAAAIIPSSKETVNIIIDPSSSTIRDCLAPLPMAQPEAIPLPMEFAGSVIDPATGKVMEYRELICNPGTKSIWQCSSANEFDHLCDGCTGRVNGTNTMRFISVHDVPKGRIVTYACFICTKHPQKKEVKCTCITVGGNLIFYPGPV